MVYAPFPGMDPYLEAPSLWPDVHTRLRTIIGEQLTPLLAPKYLAELETQVVIDHLDDDPQVVLPDVSVTSSEVSAGTSSAVAVTAPAPVQVRVPLDIPTRFPLPTISQAILMQIEDRPVLSTEQIDNTTYNVQQHELALFARQPIV
jgi:hypothetical protein